MDLKTSLVFIVLLITLQLHAQESLSQLNSKHKFGFMTGIGGQSLGHFIDDSSKSQANIYKQFFDGIGINADGKLWNHPYTYQTYFFQLQWYYSLRANEKWSYELLIQPQLNPMRFRFEDDTAVKTKGIEFGANLGFLVRRNFLEDKLSLYACLSVGPHYISKAPLRQSQGFLFSDNLFVGAQYKISKFAYLDFRPGFRHISNAGLLPLNGGINSLNATVGFMVLVN